MQLKSSPYRMLTKSMKASKVKRNGERRPLRWRREAVAEEEDGGGGFIFLC